MPVFLDELALSVARCSELSAANHPQTGREHPCHKIVRSQDNHAGAFQVPEAWAGNLGKAQVVFLSSNPAISAGIPDAKLPSKRFAEKYPTTDWSDTDIADFMINRFSPEHVWVSERRHRKVDEAHVAGGPMWGSKERYWGWIEKQTNALLGNDIPWYERSVMTEVVHCKSANEQGVQEAVQLCSAKHMGRILEASPAGLVVVVGGKAATALRSANPSAFVDRPQFGKQGPDGLPDPKQNIFEMHVGGRSRLVCFIKHPSAFGGSAHLQSTYAQDFHVLQEAASILPH
ncbi:hypothetical protein AAU01_16210 [Paenarthrobacter aurescens]|uniref:Uracil-DNA glycosylase-like domain-containing protein n=1 Tax=Paenarthrobacter aurescens TaxID=43663 RepID=A0A4Y3NIE8_PAEAU|nr:hypothetical protein AAU01_16210 [Paenarthrobacter aurescens]